MEKVEKKKHFAEENDLNYTERHNFVYDNYSFPKTRANKSEW